MTLIKTAFFSKICYHYPEMCPVHNFTHPRFCYYWLYNNEPCVVGVVFSGITYIPSLWKSANKFSKVDMGVWETASYSHVPTCCSMRTERKKMW